MTGNLKKLAMCAVVVVGGMAMAQDEGAAPRVPTAEEARAVLEYYLNGKGKGLSPVLLDVKLCTEVGKSGDEKSECIAEVSAEGVKANSKVLLWQSYMVPQGEKIEDVMVQVKQGDIVRETKDLKLDGSLRNRTWPGVRLNKAGDWNITILHGDRVLKSIDVKVL
jgi:hypothetical protein